LTTKLNRKGIWQRHGLLVFVAARHERPDGGRVPAAAAPADLPPARLRVYEVSATGGSEAKVVHGPGIDEPLGKFDRTEVPQGAWYYYHHDGLGSVTRLSRADKSMANRYVYDDFGRFRGKTEGNPNAYGFTGREHGTADLLYYRTRHYSPNEGRFASRDPGGFEPGISPYAYVKNNPLNWFDPTGRLAVSYPSVGFYAYVPDYINPYCVQICLEDAAQIAGLACEVTAGLLFCSSHAALLFGTGVLAGWIAGAVYYAACHYMVNQLCDHLLAGGDATSYCEERCYTNTLYVVVMMVSSKMGRSPYIAGTWSRY